MKVFVYSYRWKTPGQQTNPDDRIEELDDCVESSEPAIIASFLTGLANQYDPPKEIGQRTVATPGQQVRIVVQDGDKVILEVKSTKLPVVAHMLRGAANSINPNKHNMRGSE